MSKRFGRNKKRHLKNYIRNLELKLFAREVQRVDKELHGKEPQYVQGYFVDQPQYKRWAEEQKQEANRMESLLVRPSPTGNPICQCFDPADAQLIADSLNSTRSLKEKYRHLEEKYKLLKGR